MRGRWMAMAALAVALGAAACEAGSRATGAEVDGGARLDEGGGLGSGNVDSGAGGGGFMGSGGRTPTDTTGIVDPEPDPSTPTGP